MRLLILLIAIICLGCERFDYDQEVITNDTTNEVQFLTCVWDHDSPLSTHIELIYIWRDPIEDMTPELICQRKMQADSIIKVVTDMHKQKCNQ